VGGFSLIVLVDAGHSLLAWVLIFDRGKDRGVVLCFLYFAWKFAYVCVCVCVGVCVCVCVCVCACLCVYMIIYIKYITKRWCKAHDADVIPNAYMHASTQTHAF